MKEPKLKTVYVCSNCGETSPQVMAVVRNATFVLAQKGIRTEVILKADVRPGFENMMEQKVRSVDAILESDVADGDAEKGE